MQIVLYKLINLSNKSNLKFKFFLVIILACFKMLFCSEQCIGSDACGTYPGDIATDKITLTLNTNIPTGWARPILEAPNNKVNIFRSLVSKCYFSVRVESYDKCNGIPRYKTTCCITPTSTCSLTNSENAYEIPVLWVKSLKSKVTVKIISWIDNGYFSVYEGSFDIQQNTSIIPTQLSILNCVTKAQYSYYNVNINEFCTSNN